LGHRLDLGVVVVADLGDLRPPLVPGLLHDRRDPRGGGGTLGTPRVPLEEHPEAGLPPGGAEDLRAPRALRRPLLGTLRREDLVEPVEVLDRGRRQEHHAPPRWSCCRTVLDLAPSIRPASAGHIGRTPYAVCTRSCSKAQTVAAARLRTPALS